MDGPLLVAPPREKNLNLTEEAKRFGLAYPVYCTSAVLDKFIQGFGKDQAKERRYGLVNSMLEGVTTEGIFKDCDESTIFFRHWAKPKKKGARKLRRFVLGVTIYGHPGDQSIWLQIHEANE